MVTEEHLYVDAEQLGDRLGYQVEVGNEYVAIYNKNFSNTVPYGHIVSGTEAYTCKRLSNSNPAAADCSHSCFRRFVCLAFYK